MICKDCGIQYNEEDTKNGECPTPCNAQVEQ